MEAHHLVWINDQKELDTISPAALDKSLALGWRHFGSYFFRYSLSVYDDQLCKVLPLRVSLPHYSHSKSFRKIRSKNKVFQTSINPIQIDIDSIQLFEQHKTKFKESVPNSIYNFLSEEPATKPCEAKEVRVYDGEKLIAQSFFDIGKGSISSIYGMYDLNYSTYSLGIYTMLVEIDYALELGKPFYYHGYCYDTPSFYDYKKRFAGTQYYDWKNNWYFFINKL
ncbi:arginine-tRNA-protein transferase [Flammeovirgaceae bacterium SG7u.111]|nr:arginine-tRNA-protein transferase [Flammeovirgaceae bacterium SG7u.132]WPO36313.1 arginine-tRNA-protein transferase [Flammeovirgaceae bacterium SG7u.111]